MANTYMRKCSMSLIIKETHIKITMKYHFEPVRKAIIKKKNMYDISSNTDTVPYFTKTQWGRKGWTKDVNWGILTFPSTLNQEWRNSNRYRPLFKSHELSNYLFFSSSTRVDSAIHWWSQQMWWNRCMFYFHRMYQALSLIELDQCKQESPAYPSRSRMA